MSPNLPMVKVIVTGEASGSVVVLDQPLSFWGGFDASNGTVIDVHHPQHGVCLSGKVVVMERGRGSSSASSVIAESARCGTTPAALIVLESDEILSTGAIVADELYGRPVPIVEVGPATHAACAAAGMITLTAAGDLVID